MTRVPRGVPRFIGVPGVIVVCLLALGSLTLVGCAFGQIASRERLAQDAACPGLPAGELGSVAYVRSGALRVVDVGSCTRHLLVTKGAHAPVRWSPDGRWIAFRSAAVIAAGGGEVLHPLGNQVPQWDWEWSPASDEIAAVDAGGGVVIGGPGMGARQLLPDGWGATSLAFDPSGTRLAVARFLTSGKPPNYRVVDQGVWIVNVATGVAEEVNRTPNGQLATPIMAGWSPSGGWVLFWSDFQNSASIAADGLPLEAVPAEGGPTVTIASTLVFLDFLSACGSGLVVTDGGDRYVNVGKRLISVDPTSWGFVELTHDPSRGWFWPACSPNARWVAATAAPSVYPKRFGQDPRSIWLIAADGSGGLRLTDTTDGADELPRWSPDGRYVLFVRRGLSWQAAGSLYLAQIDPTSGRKASLFGPIARLGPGGGYYGHSVWSETTDWYRPAA